MIPPIIWKLVTHFPALLQTKAGKKLFGSASVDQLKQLVGLEKEAADRRPQRGVVRQEGGESSQL